MKSLIATIYLILACGSVSGENYKIESDHGDYSGFKLSFEGGLFLTGSVELSARVIMYSYVFMENDKSLYVEIVHFKKTWDDNKERLRSDVITEHDRITAKRINGRWEKIRLY